MQEINTLDEGILNQILGEVTNKIHDWVIIGDELGKILYINDKVAEVCEQPYDKIIGEDICMFLGVDLTDQGTLYHIQDFINIGKKFQFATYKLINQDKQIYLRNQLMTMCYSNQRYFICISKCLVYNTKTNEYIPDNDSDVIEYSKYKMLIDRIDTRIKKHHCHFSLMLIDVKRVKEIRNVYGNEAEQIIMNEVKLRINKVLDSSQEMFHYDASIFAIIYDDIDRDKIEHFIKNLGEIFIHPIRVAITSIYIELQVGITYSTLDKEDPYLLINKAQLALMHPKNTKGNIAYTIYCEDIKQEFENNLYTESDLKEAIIKNEFIVYYQSFINLKNNQMVGMEALLRRRKSNGEIIYPNQFIENLEKMHLIDQVGMNVIREVCNQLRIWMNKGYTIVPISVNLSAVQFRNSNLAKEIRDILEEYSIPPRYIIFEITETAVMEDMEMAQGIIEELKDYGCLISIDDFGTGYASIGYLKKFMFDHLKIDILFIREIVNNEEDRSIVEAIIAIANTFNLITIAEGIESREQLYVMNELGCQVGQGYLWDRPIAANYIEEKYFCSSNKAIDL